ncbi:MAG: DUF2796 domain-containing protein [Gammaproteobacteria bacterium]|nr:DUF2796 domain-containing protein [Gammaproteobacteria bacterium]
MNAHYIAVAFFTVALLTSPVVWAQTQRDLDSHEHGASALNVIVDDDHVYVEFESPWANLVGFEHEPGNDEQRAAVNNALESISDASSMILLDSSANCEASSSEVTSTMAMADEDHNDHDHDEHSDDEHGHDEHSDEKHDDEHGHDEHSDDKHDDEHDHDEHAHDEETHSEILVSYAFECANPDKLETMTVQLTSTFPGIEDIDVQLAGPGGQSGLELDADNNTIDLTAVK